MATPFLLVYDAFRAGDDGFVPLLLACEDDASLARFAASWYQDARPWAREVTRRYVLDGCDRPGHKPLVKRLFKAFEKADDHEAMAWFLVTFDHIDRRQMTTFKRWDWANRKPMTVTKLVRKRRIRSTTDWTTMKSVRTGTERFSALTTQYLERRVWRYFRTLGRRDPDRYRATLAIALPLYGPEVDDPAGFLSAWGLAHALYGESPALTFPAHGVDLAEGKSFADLEPAPVFPALWTGQVATLLPLVMVRSRMVRKWASALLSRETVTDVDTVIGLCNAPQFEAWELGLRWLEVVARKITVEQWLRILGTPHSDVATVAIRFADLALDPKRLSDADIHALAMAPTWATARWGLDRLRERPMGDPRRHLLLLDAPMEGIRAETAAWIAPALALLPDLAPSEVRDLLDHPHPDVREAACPLLDRFPEDAALYAWLTESPYADVRAAVIRALDRPALSSVPVTLLWRTTLLRVGQGRDRRKVLTQLADRLLSHPGEADTLLPILRVALRGVRPPERAIALAKVGMLVLRSPALRPAISAAIPELVLFEEGR